MESRISSRGWGVVALLFLFMIVNFADKTVLGLSAQPIMQELGLNHTQFGLIGASFFLFFSLGAVLVGFLVNRMQTRWALAAMAFLWSACLIPMILPATVGALIASRIVLGLGEGPAYPVALHAAFKWFRDERRARPASLIAIGSPVGAGIAAPALAYAIERWSWHAAFGALGVIGIFWCLAWLVFAREGPLNGARSDREGEGEAARPYRELLSCRTIIGVQIVGFSAYWLLTLFVVWMPSYLSEGAGFTSAQAGWILTLPALAVILFLPGVGFVSEALIKRGVASRAARGLISAFSAAAAGVLTILLPLAPGSVLPIVCLVAAFSVGNVIFVLGHVLVAELTPVRQRGAMLGIANAVMSLAGPLAPIVMGLIVDHASSPAEGYRTGLIVAGALAVAAGLAGFVLLDPQADLARLERKNAHAGRRAIVAGSRA